MSLNDRCFICHGDADYSKHPGLWLCEQHWNNGNPSLLVFDVSIIPVPKGRPRFYRRGRAMGTFTPPETVRFENELSILLRPHAPLEPIERPIKLWLQFRLPTKKNKRDFHDVRPDIDNLVKSAMDPLNGVFWKDDALIWDLKASKYFDNNVGITYVIGWERG